MKTLYNNIFKFRTGDTDDMDKGGCTLIGGSWVDKTTDDLFADKKVVLLVCLVHLHQLALANNCHLMTNTMISLKN